MYAYTEIPDTVLAKPIYMALITHQEAKVELNAEGECTGCKDSAKEWGKSRFQVFLVVFGGGQLENHSYLSKYKANHDTNEEP
jgi:hypothetical protein